MKILTVIFLATVLGGCDATMEAQNNNQPTLDNHNNLYKIPGQEDQVGPLTYSRLNVTCYKICGYHCFYYLFYLYRSTEVTTWLPAPLNLASYK